MMHAEMATNMKILIVFVVAIIAATVNCADPDVDVKFEDKKEDNSVFDKILMINQKAAMMRSGAFQPKLFQGDIVETDAIRKAISGGLKRGATSNLQKLWPTASNAGYATIPYTIGNNLRNYQRQITTAMQEWMQKVPCIRFTPRRSERNYLHFHSGSGCSSDVGRRGGVQYVSLGRGCLHHGIIVHEIGHAVGFWHEQSRPDRDRYVYIYLNNIAPNMRYNFDKNNWINSRNEPYDYSSIMHYGSKAFSINGQYTILAKNGQTIGQRQGLSKSDIKQAKIMYGCDKTIKPSTIKPTTFTTLASCPNDQNKNCEVWARGGYCNHQKERVYMMTNCRKSCCMNRQGVKCQDWINRLGKVECQNNPRYMLYECGESCNNCTC